MMTDHQKFIDLDVLVADDDVFSLESCVDMLCDLGMKAGMNWHIAKPIKVDELISSLAEILK